MRKKQLTIRQRVRVYLVENDMTQAQLAAQLGMSESKFSKVLSGTLTLDINEAAALQRITGIPAVDFARVA